MTIYSSVTVSGYNASPPSDDGTQVSSNKVNWAKHKEKIGDPLKTAIEAINTNAAAAFGKIAFSSTSAITTNFTAGVNDRGKILRVSNSPTISLGAASTLGNDWCLFIVNEGTGTITIDPNGSETINGATTITISDQYGYAIISCNGTSFVAIVPTTGYVPPVDDIEINVSGNNPATKYPGTTWAAFGTGKMLVGIDAGDTDFDTAEETGGAKSQTLNANNIPELSGTVNGASSQGGGGGDSLDNTGTGAGNIGVTVNSGTSNDPVDTVPPYIVVYMWKRTA